MQTPMDWNSITTVFLDMDGTLLDLSFDNYFWHEFVPLRFSQQNKLEFDEAKQKLLKRYKSKSGSLEWYCVDYWSTELDLDIPALKREISKRVQIFPYVEEFLTRIKQKGMHIALVTNAHRKSLEIKMDQLDLEPYFDKIISSHDYGHVKEEQAFWQQLNKAQPFNPETTLFVDDNLTVLSAAELYGIKYLVTIKQPDSSKPPQDTQHFKSVVNFEEIMPEA